MSRTPGDEPDRGAPVVTVTGGDPELARVVDDAEVGVLVRFRAVDSDLARALGLRSEATGLEVPVDAMRTPAGPAVNVIVMGTAPDRTWALTRRHRVTVEVDGQPWYAGRATAVVVANGQFLRGSDLVPRGHPGDGRLEVQVYGLPPNRRRAMRRRLATGAHLPHPDIRSTSGRRIIVRTRRPLDLELDGRPAAATSELSVKVVPGALRMLV